MSEIARNALAIAHTRAGECARRMHSTNDAEGMIDSQGADEYYENEVHAFKDALVRLRHTIVYIYEALGMTVSLDAFLKRYDDHAREPNLARILYFDGEHDLPYSPTLEFLQAEISLVEPLVRPPTEFSSERAIVSTILKQSHLLMRDFPPSKESDLRNAVFRVLRLAFPDCLKDPPTAKPTNIFKPDLGIESIRTAIEVKYVDSTADAKKVLGELFEDMKGYAGAPEWSEFQALVYQTNAYLSQEIVNAELAKVGAPGNWKIHVVSGAAADGNKKGGSASA